MLAVVAELLAEVVSEQVVFCVDTDLCADEEDDNGHDEQDGWRKD